MDKLTAKDIYWNHGCNDFHIDREGYRDEYLRLGGNNKKLEKQWRLEYIDFWFEKIPEDEQTAFHHLGQVRAIEILDKLLAYDKLSDDYIRFWYAYMLLDLSRAMCNIFKRSKARSKALEIFEDISKKTIIISSKNRNLVDGLMLHALGAKNAEEYLKNYSQRLLS